MIPSILTSESFLTASFVIALAGLTLAILADHLQTLAKYQGALKQRVAGGYNLAMKVMVVNRVGAVLYFLLIAFNIDSGLSAQRLTIGLMTTVFLLVIPTIFFLVRLQKMFDILGNGGRVLNVSEWPKPIMIATFFATATNILGLTVPWIASASYPEFRLTLANTSFLFNTIFTVIHVFYIEHRLALLIDKDEAQVHGFVAGVMVARLLAFLAVGSALGVMVY